MKMNKKAFTLVEIIICIALITLIATITIFVVKPKGSNDNEKYISALKSSAVVYFEKNKILKEIIKYNDNELYVSINHLVNSGLIDEEQFNPIRGTNNKNIMDDCVKIFYDEENVIDIEYPTSMCKNPIIIEKEETTSPKEETTSPKEETTSPKEETTENKDKAYFYWYPIEYEYRGEKTNNLSDLSFVDSDEAYKYFEYLINNEENYSIEEVIKSNLEFNTMISSPTITKVGFVVCSEECKELGTNDEFLIEETGEKIKLDISPLYLGMDGNYDNGIVSKTGVSIYISDSVNNQKFWKEISKYNLESSMIDYSKNEYSEHILLSDFVFLLDNSGPILIHKDTYKKYNFNWYDGDSITYYPRGGFSYFYGYKNYPYSDNSWMSHISYLDSSLFRDYYLFDNVEGLININKYILGTDDNGEKIYATEKNTPEEIWDKSTTRLYNQMISKLKDYSNEYSRDIELDFEDSLGNKTSQKLHIIMHQIFPIEQGLPKYINITNMSNRKEEVYEILKERVGVINNNIEKCGNPSFYKIALCKKNDDNCQFDEPVYKEGTYNYLYLGVIDNCNASHEIWPVEIELYSSYYSPEEDIPSIEGGCDLYGTCPELGCRGDYYCYLEYPDTE